MVAPGELRSPSVEQLAIGLEGTAMDGSAIEPDLAVGLDGPDGVGEVTFHGQSVSCAVVLWQELSDDAGMLPVTYCYVRSYELVPPCFRGPPDQYREPAGSMHRSLACHPRLLYCGPHASARGALDPSGTDFGRRGRR